MVEANKLLPLMRMVALGAVTLFALIVLPLSAHLIYLSTSATRALNSFDFGGSSFGSLDSLFTRSTYSTGGYDAFAAVSLATSILTIVTLPAMFVVSIKRQGAFSSFVVVEIAWMWFLWVMWLASAGSTAALYWVNLCSGGVCSEAQALEAFGFLNWLILMFYTITLLVFAIMAHIKGRSEVWKSEVTRFDWSAPSAKAAGSAGVAAPELGGVATPNMGTYQTYQTDSKSVMSAGTPVQQYPPQGVPQQAPYVGAPSAPTGGYVAHV